jgi:hypothetical protein
MEVKLILVVLVLVVVVAAGCAGKAGSLQVDARSNAPALDRGEGIEEITEGMVKLENYGPAPELNNTVWLNTDKPLRLAKLRGQVVLLDMWTFG